MTSLYQNFIKYFDIVQADTAELRQRCFALRFQVYCEENDFEDPSQFSDRLETDAYDTRSVHSLIVHRRTGLDAATVRLVLSAQDETALFPIELHCRQSFDEVALDINDMPRKKIAEISRFAVSKEFKRRLGEAGTIAGVGPDIQSYFNTQSDQRLIPHITIGLFAALLRMGIQHDVQYVYAVMEPSLIRLLTRLGVEFGKIGGLVDYHGKRQPCFAKVSQMLYSISSRRPDIWQLITNDGELETAIPLIEQFRTAPSSKYI